MPIYEYECQKCHVHTEVMQKMTEKPLMKCKACGGRLEKLWSSTSFQLKGSGWYVTDYAAKKSDGKAGKEEKADIEKESKPAVAESASTEPAKTEKEKPASTPAKGKSKTTRSKSNGD
jgi:putative FmdB family regulatory protein